MRKMIERVMVEDRHAQRMIFEVLVKKSLSQDNLSYHEQTFQAHSRDITKMSLQKQNS